MYDKIEKMQVSEITEQARRYLNIVWIYLHGKLLELLNKEVADWFFNQKKIYQSILSI